MAQQAIIPVIKVAPGSILPDNRDWTNRFEINSASSGNVYTIAQHKTKRHWGCDCMGWRRWRKCQHLQNVGLPSFEKPYEVQLTDGKK
jgi:hypothetical protein